MTNTVLVIGGYGVFGGRLAMRLARDPELDVVVAGRTLGKAEAFCKVHGGRAAKLDVTVANLGADIAALSPHIVVDAAGPFQAYGAAPYRVAQAAIASGAHYLDLSDDADFTAGLNRLDDAARAAGVAALSGVSSVPALSSAAATHLTADMHDVHVIDTQILPGNKAPRGRSVIAAILEQTGRPMKIWRGRRWQSVPGWSGRRRAALSVDGAPPITGRWASLIGAPDLHLFPDVFNARSVVFRAGLDLKLMHGGLAALSRLVRWGWIRRLTPMTGALKWTADRLEPFGSDRGGMSVRARGTNEDDTAVEAEWTLIAEDGDGPHIPAIPAAIMVRKLLSGDVPIGARACLAAFTLDEAEAELATLNTAMETVTRDAEMVFKSALGASFGTMPAPLVDLHTVLDRRIWEGKAQVTRGRGPISWVAGWIGGFPKAGTDIPLRVVQDAGEGCEVWTRTFGETQFTSHLTRKAGWGAGIIHERFGPMSFEIGLEVQGDRLAYPVRRGWCLGVPLPRFMLPQSNTHEFVDAEGRVNFSVEIRMSIGGVVVTYLGWLTPV